MDLHFNDRTAPCARGVTLFECADRLGIQVPTSCRRQGRCKECLVEIAAGADLLTPPGPEESHLAAGFRLSCRARIGADAGELRCHTLRRGEMRIETQTFLLPNGRPASLDPAVTRDGDRIFLDGVEIARSTAPIHGLAVDLGTTTVVLRLLNLETGEQVADASFENPQRFAGSDIMARIEYDSRDRTRLLQRTLAGYLTHAIEALPVDPATIHEVVIAGNSTMRDIFFRLPVQSIGQSPYQSLTEQELAAGTRTTTSLAEAAARLGLPLHPQARAYGLPIVSGHVGADAAACMLAVDIGNEQGVVAVMDIGTNTELIIGNRDRLIAASCPAGPAFEGGQIAFGMPGLPGAIERVRLGDDGSVRTTVIGGGPPQGICGSGLIDLLAELRRTERMNLLGRFEDGPAPIPVAEGDGRPISFSESDVNALAQAKGANVAGLRIALETYGVAGSGLHRFYLAGGFGRHLDVGASKRIGLIPDIDEDRIVQIGNASLEGACIALLSRSRRAELESWIRRTEHCRLETHPRFFDYFVEGCQFNPVEVAARAGSP